MTSEKSMDRAPHSGGERRRSRRLVLTVPVDLEWMSVGGEVMKAQATAHHVSVHGASVHLADGKHSPPLNTEFTLKNSLTGEVCQARVTRIRRLASGPMDSIGVELIAPSGTFWGLTFQLQQTTMQLLEIENAFQARSKDVDFRVLRSLSDAVEYLRAVASIVHQWQELQVAGGNAYSVLDPLCSARVRCATHLIRDLTADIESSELTNYSEEYAKLAQAVERLYERMAHGPYAYREVK